MPDKKKYDSDTISQQRKAREDFLELKKMQRGEIPLPESEEKHTETIKEKANNFWYYYRWWIAAALFLVVVITICVKQCASRIDYDLSVTIFTSNPVGEEDSKKIAGYFEKLCDDVNGDGEVHIQVFNCSFVNGGNRQVLLANNTKVQAIIASEPLAVLFITDEQTFAYLNNIPKQTALFEDNGIVLGRNFYENCEADDLFELPADLRISRRVINNTVLSKNKKAAECYKAAGEVLKRLNNNS